MPGLINMKKHIISNVSNQRAYKISLFGLIAINITAVLSLNSIAYMATIGLQSILFFLLATVCFFIPSAVVSAKLASMFTKNNGSVYTWVSSAFGKNTGLVAIWMEWFNNVIAFPASISSIIATSLYIGFPDLTTDTLLMFVVMVSLFWLVSIFNFLPINRIVILNYLGAVFGMIIPGVLIILGGIYYLFYGDSNIIYNNNHMPVYSSNLSFDQISSYIPATFSFATFALFAKTLSSYSGIQNVTFHNTNIDNPKKNIPLSMIISIVIIFILTTTATVSLAVIIPEDTINAMNGLIQGIGIIFEQFGISNYLPLIAALICIGMLSTLSAWILGPARAMQYVASDGLIPKIFAKTNRYGMPVNVLITQGVIGSLLSMVFLFMPTIQAAFAMLIALTAQFTILMFILIFLAAIKLQYHNNALSHNQNNSKLAYNQNKTNLVDNKDHNKKKFSLRYICCSFSAFSAFLGILSCSFGFIMALFPPKFSKIQDPFWYIIGMVIADLIIIAIPFIYIYYRKLNIK